ncbi:GTP-binding protein Era [Escherichia coli]|nr:GTP-binding protein Era [Escherichia coli]
MSIDKSYCGFIAIVGRPNVGKSTLLNKLLGQKISITSRKAQTTRHRIVGIHTEGAYQAIYVDTPGLHMEEKRAINRLMNKAASSSIGDVELVIFVVEGTRWTPDDEMVLNKLRDGKAPVILAVNKVDNVQEKSRSAATLTVPGKPDELPRYRADLCRNRAECRHYCSNRA